MATQILTLNKSTKLNHPFLQELIRQIRQSDTCNKYENYTDDMLINQLIIPSNCSINQIFTRAFYQATGVIIERKTGYPTNTFVHLKDKKLSSAVICCGGVIVLSSVIREYLNFACLSLTSLIEYAETIIDYALAKASQYLDISCA